MTPETPVFRPKQITYDENESNKLEKFFSDPELKNQLEKLCTQLKEILEEICSDYPDRKILLVVGGKSRRIVELFLQNAVAQMSDGSDWSEILKERIRLTDHENKNLYGELSSTQIDEKKDIYQPLIPKAIRDQSNSHPVIVYVDDHVAGRKKAKKMLQALHSIGFQATFVSLVGAESAAVLAEKGKKATEKPDELSQFRDNGFDGSIRIAYYGGELSRHIDTFSRAYSHLIDVRMNSLSQSHGSIEKTHFSQLPETRRQLLVKLNTFMKRLRVTLA